MNEDNENTGCLVDDGCSDAHPGAEGLKSNGMRLSEALAELDKAKAEIQRLRNENAVQKNRISLVEHRTGHYPYVEEGGITCRKTRKKETVT